MKYIAYILIGIITITLIWFIFLSVSSRFVDNIGMVKGKLLPCPDTPNCVCTEDYPNQNFKPIQIKLKNKDSEWVYLKSAIIESGGEIHQDNGYYLQSTFVTPLFRFVDDFEARMDTVKSCIHLRSASRVGDYDFGTNLKRINKVVKIYKEKKSRQLK